MSINSSFLTINDDDNSFLLFNVSMARFSAKLYNDIWKHSFIFIYVNNVFKSYYIYLLVLFHYSWWLLNCFLFVWPEGYVDCSHSFLYCTVVRGSRLRLAVHLNAFLSIVSYNSLKSGFVHLRLMRFIWYCYLMCSTIRLK